TGHADRTATVTCTNTACQMPPRSKDLAVLRAFAAQHAAAHAKAAKVRPNASCHCRSLQCGAHPDTKVHCTGSVVLIVRHDPSVGRVWSVEEVCEMCAPLIPNATVVARAARRPSPDAPAAGHAVPAPAPAPVPGGFSSAGATDGSEGKPVRRSRRTVGKPRGRRSAQGR
ncbi:hypothetical protein ABZ864_47695, partial [Streptomyces sp. NPDC047082]|uniref:hypothetical protein n=1 Tax=Streptomyces sp. NPDC047082 TaxID=3155259 RepID=UPI003407C5F0